MVAGFERYYQIARCFRDEDLRADRQPEFTQLDLEMSFVEEEDVIEVMEAVMTAVFAATGFAAPPAPWERIEYADAMLRYGSDRPDRRFGLEISELGADAGGHGVQGLRRRAVLRRGRARPQRRRPRGAALRARRATPSWPSAPGRRASCGPSSRTTAAGARRSRSSSRPSEIAAVTETLGGSPGDLLLVVADTAAVAADALGALRLHLRDRFDLAAGAPHDLHWVVDFPLFGWNADEERWDALHHPFTAPRADQADAFARGEIEAGDLVSRGYDLVLDGSEIGGGSVRINLPEVQQAVFDALGSRPRRPRRASASCCARCARARRRTAGSRWASTASPRSSPGATRSARSSPSRRPPRAPIR